MNILVSACLLGVNCRYSGTPVVSESVLSDLTILKRQHHLIPVCPEIMGGLPTPRPAAECLNGRVITKNETDVTTAFQKGAQEVQKLAEWFGCHYAILKERSPSCGAGQIYDGHFSGKLTEGDGVTARLLQQYAITVIGESQLHDFCRTISQNQE